MNGGLLGSDVKRIYCLSLFDLEGNYIEENAIDGRHKDNFLPWQTVNLMGKIKNLDFRVVNGRVFLDITETTDEDLDHKVRLVSKILS